MVGPASTGGPLPPVAPSTIWLPNMLPLVLVIIVSEICTASPLTAETAPRSIAALVKNVCAEASVVNVPLPAATVTPATVVVMLNEVNPVADCGDARPRIRWPLRPFAFSVKVSELVSVWVPVAAVSPNAPSVP